MFETFHCTKKSGPSFKRQVRQGETDLLVFTPLVPEADDGLAITTREVTDGARLFVGNNVSLSRRNVNHDDVR